MTTPGAVRALWARPLAVPRKALRPRWPAGYQARLRRPGNAVLSKITHPLNIIDFIQMFDGPRAWETLARRQAQMKTGAMMVSMEHSVPTVTSHLRGRSHPFQHNGVCRRAFLRADTRNSPNSSCKSVALCTGAQMGAMRQTHKRACTGALTGGCMSVRRRGSRGSDWEDKRESRKDRRDEKPGVKRTSLSGIEYGGRTERTA